MEGLKRIHAAGVLHGNIRTSKVVLRDDSEGQPMWVGFSCAELVDRAARGDHVDRDFEAEQAECRGMLQELRLRLAQRLQRHGRRPGRDVATSALPRRPRVGVLRQRPIAPKLLRC